MARSWREYKKIIAPALKQQELIQKAIREASQPIIEMQEAMRKASQPILNIQEAIRKASQPIIEMQEAIRKAGEFIIPAFEQLKKSFQELPPRTQEALILLGTHGWYFDLEMPITALWQLKKAITKGNIKEAEDALIEYFENKLDEIEESIVKRFPHRDKIIRIAFKAHRRKEYELSIPVFLSQTDGICKEVINAHLFRRKNNKPRTEYDGSNRPLIPVQIGHPIRNKSAGYSGTNQATRLRS